MPTDEPTHFLSEVTRRLDMANAAVDRLIAVDDPDVSYAATTAALHLHAVQSDLPTSQPPETAVRTAANEASPGETVDALNDLVSFVNDWITSLPTTQQAAAARVSLHVAEARDVLVRVSM